LHLILKKNISFHWIEEQGDAFQKIKRHLTHVVISGTSKIFKIF